MLFSSKRSGLNPEGRRKGLLLPWRLIGFILVMLLLVSNGLSTLAATPDASLAATTPNASSSKQFRYFDATGHSLSGPLLRYYTITGGEDRHGKPLSEPVRNKNHYDQYFERSILEFYPDYVGSDQEVQLASLGQLVADDANMNFEPVTPFLGTAEKWYFPQTGHSLSEPFLSYWRNSGDESTLGLPISEELNEPTSDGTKLTVQYFQNVKLQRVGTDTISISNLGTLRASQQLKPAQLAAVPRARFDAPRAVKIPSLMFHYARLVDEKKDPLGYSLSVTPDNYIKYLDWMQANGYNTVTASQVLDYFKYGILLPDKAVMIRWDDGHDNNWFVYQEMKKRGMTATFFVISQRLELTPAQWQQIDKDGFEVTAHTRTHPDLRGVRDLAGEITGSKTDIERMLGHPIRTFAYPYGKYGDTIKKVVRDSGFEMALSTDGGYNWNLDNLFQEPVLSVIGIDNLYTFSLKVAAPYGLPPAPLNNPAKAQAPSPTNAATPPATPH